MTRIRSLVLLSLLVAGGCKTIPPDAYGIARLRFHGVEEMDDAALRACLATRERSAFQVDLGTSSELTCNEPPFDGGRVPLRLVTWPWTEWPTYDAAVFERDLDRIERWYRARGFYDARVERAEFAPESARQSDELPPVGETPCERRSDDEGCRLEIDVHVSEGEPVHVRHLVVTGHESLANAAQRRITGAVELHEGDRFDEALHDRTKTAIVTTLRESGYACADVTGLVELDPDQRIADVTYTVRPGTISEFHDVRVEVTSEGERIPLDVVKAVAGIERGMRYAPSRIANAQRDVYALGAFSAVEVEAVPVRPDGTQAENTHTCTGEVDVLIRVTPGRRIRYGLGVGLDSGQISYLGATPQTTNQVPQWNVHLVARFEHRNLLGGLRRLRIEDRPKIVFQDPFPGVTGGPIPGNELSFDFRQPAFLERATTLNVSGRWDLGPDPNYGGLRHLIDVGGAVQRSFFGGHLTASLGDYGSVYRLVNQPPDPDGPSGPLMPGVLQNYAISFLRQYLAIDFRDDPHVTRKGIFFTLDVNEAGFARLADWSYVRVISEVRGFIPLPYRFTIAARFQMGGIYMYNRPNDPTSVSAQLGPTAYRLRGGGPNSHRGYTAGALGDDSSNDPAGGPAYRPIDGGLAKWEASLEVRTRITESLGAVFFADAGDVNRQLAFRFNQPHLAIGFGLRYYTVIGPIRVDFGFRIPRAAAFGTAVDRTPDHSLIFNSNVGGAISLTIGEAF